MNKDYDFFLRIGVDGERSVGKSGLIYKFTENDFKNGVYEETLQVYVTTTLIHLDNYTIKVEFLETGWNLRPNKNYYSYIDGAILVYDVSETNGLEKIKELSREYTNTDSDYLTNKIPIMIIANKWDEYKQKSKDDLLKEIKNFVGEEFLRNVASENEKTSASIEEILKKCISILLDFKEINNLNELTSPNNQIKPMMKHAIKLYLYGIPKKIIDNRLEVLNEEMDGVKSFLSLERINLYYGYDKYDHDYYYYYDWGYKYGYDGLKYGYYDDGGHDYTEHRTEKLHKLQYRLNSQIYYQR